MERRNAAEKEKREKERVRRDDAHPCSAFVYFVLCFALFEPRHCQVARRRRSRMSFGPGVTRVLHMHPQRNARDRLHAFPVLSPQYFHGKRRKRIRLCRAFPCSRIHVCSVHPCVETSSRMRGWLRRFRSRRIYSREQKYSNVSERHANLKRTDFTRIFD